MASSRVIIKSAGLFLCIVLFFSMTAFASDPNLMVSATSVSWTAYEGGTNPDPNILAVWNAGGGTLNWSIDTAGKPDWLNITPTSGSLDPNESEPVTVSADIAGLTAGQYNYTFQVSAPLALNSPSVIDVNLEVFGSILDISSNVITFTAYELGTNPAAQTLTIQNIGGGTLEWAADLTDKPDWLNVNPTGGLLDPKESEPVTFSVDITGLSGGEYTYVFDVIDPMAQHSPQSIRVKLTIPQVIYVDVDNSNDPLADGSVSHPFDTIQAGIDAVKGDANYLPLDTVVVSPGTYHENIHFNGKNIILTSTDPDDPAIVESTVIDGGGNGSVVAFSWTETPDCLLRGFTITNGYATEWGGGIYGRNSQATIEKCVITGNRAYSGGGLSFCDGAITNCAITGNTAYRDGGGLTYCDGAITNCTIAGNTAYYYGGGLYRCDYEITNCTISGNTANASGGGVYGCDGAITNCIVWNNRADNSGDQLYYSSTPTYSCIQDWTGGGAGNIASDPLLTDVSSSNVNLWNLRLLPGSSCIDAGTNTPPGGLPATDSEGFPRPFDGDLDGTPVADMGAYEFHEILAGPYLNVSLRFVTFTAYETDSNPSDQLLAIQNLGSQPLNWSVDLADRPAWLTVMPASGSLSPNESEPVTLSVDTAGLSGGWYSYSFDVFDPASQNSPQTVTITLKIGDILVPGYFSTIQGAIDASVDGDTLVVSPGTYYENIHFNGKNIILTSTDPDDPAIVESTVIDGGGNGSVVAFSWTTPDCLLRGFTITNGYAELGGGIYGVSTRATITNCRIIENSTASFGFGGGLYDCDGAITNCTIAGNTAYYYGGGLYYCDGPITNCTITGNNTSVSHNAGGGGLSFCDGPITNCTIAGNTSYEYGGGLDLCDGPITNCTISGNTSGRSGGGLDLCDGPITNCTISGNTSYEDGGGLYRCDGPITNCTIAGNTSYEDGGGLFLCDGSIKNCIVWNNYADTQGDQLYRGSTPTYSCIQDWTAGGTGNISSNPLFADAVNGDYHLKSEYGRWDPNNCYQWVVDFNTSPCIDAGDPISDWTAELWPHGGRINMGAYGGTPQASMSGNLVGNVADLDHDDAVGLLDLDLLCEGWLLTENLLDTDLNRNGVVDIADFAEFSSQWLWRQE